MAIQLKGRGQIVPQEMTGLQLGDDPNVQEMPGLDLTQPAPAPQPPPPPPVMANYFRQKYGWPEDFQKQLKEAQGKDDEAMRWGKLGASADQGIQLLTGEKLDSSRHFVGAGDATRDVFQRMAVTAQEPEVAKGQMDLDLTRMKMGMQQAMMDPAHPLSQKVVAAAMQTHPELFRALGVTRPNQLSAYELTSLMGPMKDFAGLANTQSEVEKNRATAAKTGEEVQALHAAAQPVSQATIAQARTYGVRLDPGITEGAAKQRIEEAQKAQELGLKREQLELEKGNKSTKGMDDLRKEFQGRKEFQDIGTVAQAYQNILSAGPGGPGDVVLLYSMVKMLDPGSVVREGEVQLTTSASGAARQFANIYQRVWSGSQLPAATRAQYVQEAHKMYDNKFREYSELANQYRRLAGQRDIPAGDVVLDRALPQPGQSGLRTLRPR